MEMTNTFTLNLTDEQYTSILNIGEYDKQKDSEVIEHVVALGISARENSIKASRKREALEAQENAKSAVTLIYGRSPGANVIALELMSKDIALMTDYVKLLSALQTELEIRKIQQAAEALLRKQKIEAEDKEAKAESKRA